jgi:hypothetical protein
VTAESTSAKRARPYVAWRVLAVEFGVASLALALLVPLLFVPAFDDGDLTESELALSVVLGLTAGIVGVWLADHKLGLLTVGLGLGPMIVSLRIGEGPAFVIYFYAFAMGATVARAFLFPAPSRPANGRSNVAWRSAREED